MRRFDSCRQEENETIPDFEQALRSLHREAWPAATPEQRDAAFKRRFEDGLLSTEMFRFLHLHARDLDFHVTFVKARRFEDAKRQSRSKKRVNFIENRPKSPVQPEWEPLLQGLKNMMAEALSHCSRLSVRRRSVTPLVQPRLPHPSCALPPHSSTRRREGHGRTSSRATLSGSAETPTSPATSAADFSSRRVGAITTTIVRRLHQTLRAVNNRSSEVQPP